MYPLVLLRKVSIFIRFVLELAAVPGEVHVQEVYQRAVDSEYCREHRSPRALARRKEPFFLHARQKVSVLLGQTGLNLPYLTILLDYCIHSNIYC
jgi:hypothetical protein